MTELEEKTEKEMSRRSFLGKLGTGIVALALGGLSAGCGEEVLMCSGSEKDTTQIFESNLGKYKVVKESRCDYKGRVRDVVTRIYTNEGVPVRTIVEPNKLSSRTIGSNKVKYSPQIVVEYDDLGRPIEYKSSKVIGTNKKVLDVLGIDKEITTDLRTREYNDLGKLVKETIDLSPEVPGRNIVGDTDFSPYGPGKRLYVHNYEYNQSGNLIRESEGYVLNGIPKKPQRIRENEYDSKNNLVKMSVVTLDTINFRIFDSHGNLIEEGEGRRRNSGASLDKVIMEWTKEYKYNSQNNLVESMKYDVGKRPVSWEKYEYDKKGRIIRRTKDSNKGEKLKRNIRAYEKDKPPIYVCEKGPCYHRKDDCLCYSKYDSEWYEYSSDGFLSYLSLVKTDTNGDGFIDHIQDVYHRKRKSPLKSWRQTWEDNSVWKKKKIKFWDE